MAALASWLDARAAGGVWLVRIEDVDQARCVPGAAEVILSQLTRCGLIPDEATVWQSTRGAAYAAALQQLLNRNLAYGCACTRKDIDDALAAQGTAHQRFGERVYPGTCRGGLQGRPARAFRLRAQGQVTWMDRCLGLQAQDVGSEVGDFVLKRADGLWAYQMAVVVDDAAQGITDVVRGLDLADNTARQILLQQALGLPRPRYLHTPLVLAADGFKLSKQNGAEALDLRDPLAALAQAGAVLGLPIESAAHTGTSVEDWLNEAVGAWAGIIAGFATRGDPP